MKTREHVKQAVTQLGLRKPAIQVVHFIDYLAGRHASQMKGRIFDLSKKQLVELDGFSIYVMENDYVGRGILRNRRYEAHVTQVLKQALKPGDVFLDLGANVGYFTFLSAALLKNTGKVIAFEPNPQNLQLLYSSLLLSGADNIQIYPYAVSDSSRVLKFLTVGSNGGVCKDGHDLLVQAVMLDEVLKQEPRIDVVKIDIEGHEPAALKGMETLLRKFKPKLFTEFHPYMHGVSNMPYLKYLYALGYNLSIIETPTGSLRKVACAEEVITYWEGLQSKSLHLDLYAVP